MAHADARLTPARRPILWRRTIAGRPAAGSILQRSRPYRLQTSAKAERFNRTLPAEWADVQVRTSDQQPAAALDDWLQPYTHHRPHTAAGGLPAIGRVNNADGSYIPGGRILVAQNGLSRSG